MLKRIAARSATWTPDGRAGGRCAGRREYLSRAGLARAGMDRVTADHMGMLAIRSMRWRSRMRPSLGAYARVMSALRINEFCEDYIRRSGSPPREGPVVIFGAGTGNPFFTTDTAASLRASKSMRTSC